MIKLPTLRALILAAFAAFAGVLPAWATPVTYHVSVDTTAANLTSGFLDFQFNPLFGGAPASATVSGFGGDLTLVGSPTLDGGASGALPGMQTFSNSDLLNASLQAVIFGTGFGFDLMLDGPDTGTTDPTSFFLGIYDDSFLPILGADANGISLVFELTAGSAPVVTQYDDDAITVTAVNDVPEPATLALVMAACLAAGAVSRTRRTASLSTTVD